jgi:hypothetical protein
VKPAIRWLYTREGPYNVDEGLREMERFFQGKDQVHKTLARLVKQLKKANIDYVIVGGMALNVHNRRRVTTNVDTLVKREGFQAFCARFLNDKDYERAPRRTRRLIDRKNGVTIDFLLAGLYPGFGDKGPFAFPDPLQVREEINGLPYVNLVTLIELKLVARRWQDFADVVALIQGNHLDEEYAKRLHRSVRRDYLGCLDEAREEKRREEKYESQE